MTDPEKIADFLRFIKEAQQEYKEGVSGERETESQLQDIAHRLEIYTDSYHETAQLGKLFRQVRRTRREAKEAQELNEPLVNWAESSKAALKSLERLMGTLRHIREVQEKRAYFPRSHILDHMTGGEQKAMRSEDYSAKSGGEGCSSPKGAGKAGSD